MPTSFHTAELSDIVLSETERTKLVFEPIHVDNPNDMEKQLKGKLVFGKPTRRFAGQDLRRLTRRDIQSNEYIELSLDTDEVYRLAEGLRRYCGLTRGRQTSVEPATFVETTVDVEMTIRLISERPEIVGALSNSQMDILSVAMRVDALKKTKDKIEANLTNGDEGFWQTLFKENSWVLSNIFACPYMFFQNQPYVGGKGIEGRSGRFPDYLYRNQITDNISLIEIKTPVTELIYSTQYRDDVYSVHRDLSGSVAQVLLQRDTLYKNYHTICGNSEKMFEALNFECILIVGNVGAIDNRSKKRSFEMYRNEMKNIRIVGFDELLVKITTMIDLLNGEADT